MTPREGIIPLLIVLVLSLAGALTLIFCVGPCTIHWVTVGNNTHKIVVKLKHKQKMKMIKCLRSGGDVVIKTPPLQESKPNNQ